MFSKNLLRTPSQIFGMRAKGGTFGVEIELESSGAFPEDTISGWVVHREGSLRGNGREYVSSQPYSFKEIRANLERLETCLKNARTPITESYRTSTHIHFNSMNLTFLEILGMMVTFATIEPVMLAAVGGNRDGNLFCLPNYDTGDIHQHVHSLINFIHQPDARPYPQRGKYASLNTDPLNRFGSIEYRIFPSTIIPGQILRWCRWIQNISDLSKEHAKPGTTFADIIKLAKSDENRFAYSLLTGVSDLQKSVEPALISDLICLGCEQAYEITRLLKETYAKEERKIERDKVKKTFSEVTFAEENPF